MIKDRDADLPEQVMWEGQFVTAKKRGRWEYVGRARGSAAEQWGTLRRSITQPRIQGLQQHRHRLCTVMLAALCVGKALGVFGAV